MKIEYAQLHMYTNIMYKFQSSTCKTVGEKLQTKLCPWTDRQPWGFQYTPLHFVAFTNLWRAQHGPDEKHLLAQML